jgi:serine/threonine protein kinase
MANSPARAAVDVGSVIAGTYKIEALLGRGGMGAVFLASHLRLAGKRVAIKILHTEIEGADIIARFKREAEIAAKLNHPNIVGVVDYNVAPDGMPYLVLDYLEGETLAERIARGPVPLDQVVSIVRQIGSALAAAHRAGIVHRDLKPQNIFLVPTEVDGRVVEIAKVLDFGISKIRGSQTVKTQDSALLGTPQYMAPEQATGQHASVDERTDVFALGAIVYEMLSGEAAFAGASIPEVVFKVVYEQPPPLVSRAPSVPPAVEAAVSQAMAKQSDQRFATVTAFVEAVTGQPLSLSRGPVALPPAGADSPSASRRVATGEALAQTMGSGDHGQAPVGRSAPGATGITATLPPLPPVPPTVAVPPAVPPATSVDRPAPPRRSTGAIVALALVGAAAAAGAAYFAIGRRPAHTGVAAVQAADDRKLADRGPAAAPPSVAGATAAVPAAPPDQPTSDRKLAAADPVPRDPPPSTALPPARAGLSGGDRTGRPRIEHASGPKAAPHSTSPPTAEPEAAGDADAVERLAQATAALERRDYDAAERLAIAVINAPASPRQRAAARLIHGTVQCAARNDQEAAQIDLRALENFRALRARLLAACRNHGINAQ